MWLKNFIKGCLHPLTVCAAILFKVVEYMYSNHFDNSTISLVFFIMIVLYRMLVEFYCVRDGSELHEIITTE